MSSTLCQELPSCLQPRLFEPPQLSIDKFTLPKSNSISQSILELATNTSQQGPQMTEVETEQVYVHPLVKRSSSTLTTKSLEICTESLGSETGSSIDDFIDDLLPSNPNQSMEKQSSQRSIRSREFINIKNKDRTFNMFPPPLTSISGYESLKVRPHRECGRLVLKAVCSSNSCFQAERVDGRLRLYSFLENVENVDQENCTEEVDDDGNNEVGLEIESYSDSEEKSEGIKDGKFDRKIEREEFARPMNSCKEGGPRKSGMLNWGTFWVAIS